MSASNFDRYDLGLPGTLGANIRENLSNVVNLISPTDTPFYSGIGMSSTDGSQFDWTRQELEDTDTDNARVDGADAGADESKPNDRMLNVCQISDKRLRISGRSQDENTVGDTGKMVKQILWRSMALRRDMEAILTSNQASLHGDSTTASRTGGLAAWLETNTNRDATSGADGGYNTATGIVDAATDSSATRALAQADLDAVIVDAWNEGGAPDVVMVGGKVKQRISEFLISGSTAKVGAITSQIEQRSTAQAVATQGVDVYVSALDSELRFVPNRFQRERDVFVLDMSLWDCMKFRDFRINVLAKTGDAENRQVIVDYGLRSWNEKGSGIVADIDETAPMTA